MLATAKQSVSKEITGLQRMTPQILRRICKDTKQYQTPRLNDTLYLHFHGFQAIESLEEYTGLLCLWLDSNAISEIQNIDHQPLLKCLYLQKNLIKRIENLENCKELDTLNLANNHIRKVENCGVGVLPVLSSLNLSYNYLRDYDSLLGLVDCANVSVLDLANNRIDDILVVKIFGKMASLRVLVLQGNPVVSQLPQYRRTLILECKELTYLDSRPVFDKDRACAEAWHRGGFEEERKENTRWNRAERRKMRENINGTIRMRNRYRLENDQLSLLCSSDSEDDEAARRSQERVNAVVSARVSADLDIWDEVANGDVSDESADLDTSLLQSTDTWGHSDAESLKVKYKFGSDAEKIAIAETADMDSIIKIVSDEIEPQKPKKLLIEDITDKEQENQDDVESRDINNDKAKCNDQLEINTEERNLLSMNEKLDVSMQIGEENDEQRNHNEPEMNTEEPDLLSLNEQLDVSMQIAEQKDEQRSQNEPEMDAEEQNLMSMEELLDVSMQIAEQNDEQRSHNEPEMDAEEQNLMSMDEHLDVSMQIAEQNDEQRNHNEPEMDAEEQNLLSMDEHLDVSMQIAEQNDEQKRHNELETDTEEQNLLTNYEVEMFMETGNQNDEERSHSELEMDAEQQNFLLINTEQNTHMKHKSEANLRQAMTMINDDDNDDDSDYDFESTSGTVNAIYEISSSTLPTCTEAERYNFDYSAEPGEDYDLSQDNNDYEPEAEMQRMNDNLELISIKSDFEVNYNAAADDGLDVKRKKSMEELKCQQESQRANAKLEKDMKELTDNMNECLVELQREKEELGTTEVAPNYNEYEVAAEVQDESESESSASEDEETQVLLKNSTKSLQETIGNSWATNLEMRTAAEEQQLECSYEAEEQRNRERDEAERMISNSLEMYGNFPIMKFPLLPTIPEETDSELADFENGVTRQRNDTSIMEYADNLSTATFDTGHEISDAGNSHELELLQIIQEAEGEDFELDVVKQIHKRQQAAYLHEERYKHIQFELRRMEEENNLFLETYVNKNTKQNMNEMEEVETQNNYVQAAAENDQAEQLIEEVDTAKAADELNGFFKLKTKNPKEKYVQYGDDIIKCPKSFEFEDIESDEEFSYSEEPRQINDNFKSLHSVLGSFDKFIGDIINGNRETQEREEAERLAAQANTEATKMECMKSLLKSPYLKEYNSDTPEKLDAQIELAKSRKKRRVQKLVERVYAQKHKYDDTLEVVDDKLMVINKQTGDMEDVPAPLKKCYITDSEDEQNDEISLSSNTSKSNSDYDTANETLDDEQLSSDNKWYEDWREKNAENKSNTNSNTADKFQMLQLQAVEALHNVDSEFMKTLNFDEVAEEADIDEEQIVQCSRSYEELRQLSKMEEEQNCLSSQEKELLANMLSRTEQTVESSEESALSSEENLLLKKMLQRTKQLEQEHQHRELEYVAEQSAKAAVGEKVNLSYQSVKIFEYSGEHERFKLVGECLQQPAVTMTKSTFKLSGNKSWYKEPVQMDEHEDSSDSDLEPCVVKSKFRRLTDEEVERYKQQQIEKLKNINEPIELSSEFGGSRLDTKRTSEDENQHYKMHSYATVLQALAKQLHGVLNEHMAQAVCNENAIELQLNAALKQLIDIDEKQLLLQHNELNAVLGKFINTDEYANDAGPPIQTLCNKMQQTLRQIMSMEKLEMQSQEACATECIGDNKMECEEVEHQAVTTESSEQLGQGDASVHKSLAEMQLSADEATIQN